ncbi:response regulator transcription factor [Salinimicrobium soli]|uniref:response regulator transcription factor n=1 Tax=Salinimicrobium soli TaxID=1254399 RepID=UPI003AAA81E5
MERRQLLLITRNSDFGSSIEKEAGIAYETTTVKNMHAGYSMALGYLPDIILIDYASLGLESLKNLPNFKSSHFLNKSFLFLYGDRENKKVLDKNFKEHVDGILYDSLSYKRIIEEMEDIISSKRCLTNYWKDSFMGLFNLLQNPVILLQDEKIIAINDAFKKDFFVTTRKQIKLTDLVLNKNKAKVRETLRKFIKSKHLKASTTTTLLMNEKLREAKVTFSKLDKALNGQMIMMINFTGKEFPINQEIGTASAETEAYFSNSVSCSEEFTKREKEIISLLCKGYKTKEISEALCISAKTIEKHRANIVKRTHSGTILESIVYALNHNLIDI